MYYIQKVKVQRNFRINYQTYYTIGDLKLTQEMSTPVTQGGWVKIKLPIYWVKHLHNKWVKCGLSTVYPAWSKKGNMVVTWVKCLPNFVVQSFDTNMG